MVKVVVFEDACNDIQEWDVFNEDEIKEYVGWDDRVACDDDQDTKITWVVEGKIASIPFCEGPHFIFILSE